MRCLDRCERRNCFSYGKGVPPERLAISPVSGLNPRAPCEHADRDSSSNCEKCAAVSPGADQITGGPGNKQIQTNMWQVGVAVSVCLYANLHEPDYGGQHYHVPPPACNQIPVLPTKSNHHDGYQD